MSINMSNVKAITLGGRNVKKIEDKNGNVLWEEIKADTILITVGKGQDITTTQDYNRIVVPSLSSIKSAVAKKASISSSNVSIYTVEISLETTPLAVKHTTSSSRDTKIRFFLVLGSTISSPVLARGDGAYTVDFTSGNMANTPIQGAFSPKWSGEAYIDITSYLYESSARAIYGGYAMGTSSTQYNSQTPLNMFGTSSNTGVHMCGYDKSSLPTFSIRVSYTKLN